MAANARPAVLAVLVGWSLLASGCGGGDATNSKTSAAAPPPEPGLALDADGRLEIKRIFLGVSCPPKGNFVGCDRVCLYVSVPVGDPSYVQASLAGYELRMPNVHGNSYEGCLSRDGLLHRGPLAVDANGHEKWFGSPPVAVPVDLRAVFSAEGRYVKRHVALVLLSAGYG